MSTSELDSRNIAISMRKSVENLVISSQDAIGQSISQALTFSGVITQQAHQIIQDTRNVSRSPSPSLRNSEGPDSLENDKDFPGGDLSESRYLHASDTSIHIQVPQHPAGDSASVCDLPIASPAGRGDKGSTPNAPRGSEPRTKKKSWYTSLYPTYKSKSDDFKRLFKDLPDDERLIVDYSCALQKDILAHGRLYASQNYLCFYASIFGWETSMTLRWKEVTAITKEKTALVIPNAILVCTESEKNFLTSFSGRDKAYLMLFRIWQNALMDQPCSSQEIWQWVHSCYGEELGFGSEDEGYSRDLQHDALPLDTHSEHELLESCMDGAGRDDRPRSARDRSPPLVTNGDAESEYRQGVGVGDADADALPTDMSDSSDSGDKHTEIEKCTSGHGGKLLLQSQFPFNIDQLFTMIFTNSRFNLELLAARGTTDYVQAPWQPAGGVKCRQVSYVLGLTSGPIGPKEVHVTETQVMNKCSKPGLLYSIDATSENSGIPYADYFTVEVHYCLCRVGDHTTLLTLYGHIKYKKSMWPMVKAFLEKNAMSGIEEYAHLLETRLAGEAESAQPLTRTARRRKHAHASPADPFPLPAHPPAAAPRPAPPRARPSADWLPAALVLLLLLNGLLYWKLYHPPHTSIHDLQAKMQALQEPGQAEWAALLDAHSRQRRGQLLAWREALGSTRARLQQTEEALRNLLETIETSLAKDEETNPESTEPTSDGTQTDTTDRRAHAPPDDTDRGQERREL